jgi:hypothetical protein
VTGAGDFHHNAPDGAREASLVEHRANFLLRSFGIAQPSRMENVKIDEMSWSAGHFRDQGKQRAPPPASREYSACVVKT